MTAVPFLVLRAYTVICVAAMLAAASVHAATYGPQAWGPELLTLALAMFPAVFVLFLPAILMTSLSRAPVERLIADLPRFVKIAGAAALAYVVVDFFVLFGVMQGADIANPWYVARLFSGHELAFFGFAAAIGYEFERIRRGRLDVNALPADRLLEQRPLPVPLSRSLTLQTQLTPAECAARLLATRPPRSFWFATTYPLRGSAGADSFRVERGGPQSSMVYGVGRFEGSTPTFIRLLVTFKRWVLITLGVVVVAFPVWVALLSYFRYPFGWQGLTFIVVFAIGANLVFGLLQMRSLINQIKRATESQEVSIG